MPVQLLKAERALGMIDGFDAVIDARSEGEYALDHLPHAVNWPTLNDQQRIDIGTLYTQVNPFEAKKRGAALAARNIAAHIEREVIDLPRNWRPLVYCWRGGNRSGALATVLGAIGFQVGLIEGGYRAWRAAQVLDLTTQAKRLQYRVVCGPTGSGKTRLLQALAVEGAQVLDLEALACHRSSVLGHVPGQAQPSQKRFDGLVWNALRSHCSEQPVYVESESKKVGNLRVPEPLIQAMRASPCIDLRLSDEERVALLLEDYRFFVLDSAHFCERLQALNARCGRTQVMEWTDLVHNGQTQLVVKALLKRHYDPLYGESIGRNFAQFPLATPCELSDRSAPALRQAALALMAEDGSATLAVAGQAATQGR